MQIDEPASQAAVVAGRRAGRRAGRGGECQSLAIARAVLRYIAQARDQGIGVIFITHNVHHAYPIADRFTILKRGNSLGTFEKSEVTREEVASMMAGGEDMENLSAEMAEFERIDHEETGRD